MAAASSMIGRAFIEVAMDSSRVPAGINKASSSVKSGVKTINAETKRGMDSLVGYFQKVQGLLTTLAAGGGAVAAVKAFANYSDRIFKQAYRAHVSPEFVQEWEFIEKSIGLAAGSMDELALKFNTLAVKANKGDKAALGALDKMGVTAKEFSNMDMVGKMELIFDSIHNARTEAEKYDLALAVAGKSAQKLMYAARDGWKATREAGKDLDTLGAKLSDVEIVQGERVAQEFTRLSTAVQGFFLQIGNVFAKPAEGILHFLADLIGHVNNFIRSCNEATDGMLGWGLAAGGTALALGSIIPLLIKIGGCAVGFLKFTGAAKGLGIAVAALSNPFVALGAVVVGVIGYFGLMSDEFQTSMDSIKDYLAAGDVGGAFKAFWEGLSTWFKGWGTGLAATWKTIIASILKATSGVLNQLGIHELDEAARKADEEAQKAWITHEEKKQERLAELDKTRADAAEKRIKHEKELADRAKETTNTNMPLIDEEPKIESNIKQERFSYANKTAGSFSGAEAVSNAGSDVKKIGEGVEKLIKLQVENNRNIENLGVAR